MAHIEQIYRQLAQQCADRMGAAFLRNVGTELVARDMDVVRQALGDEQINYLGFSYGTELGTAYVERFGNHVRSMVLDGAIDPTVGPIDENVNQEAGFQTAFNDYAADCARSPACPWAPTRPSGSPATTSWSTRSSASRARRRTRAA